MGAVVFSVRRARADYALPDKPTRTVLARGVLPRTGLDLGQVLALRLLVDADRIPATNPALAVLRDQETLAAARLALNSPAPELLLVITATGARICPTPETLAAMIVVAGEKPVLVLPLGRWATDMLGVW